MWNSYFNRLLDRRLFAAIFLLVSSVSISILFQNCSWSGFTANEISAVQNASTDQPLPAFDVQKSLRHIGVLILDDFGAKGDGVTDDSAALVSALSASSNIVMFLPHGKQYLITQKISINRPLSIFSDGSSGFVFSGNSGFVIQAQKASGFVFHNISFSGEKMSAESCGISIDNSNDATTWLTPELHVTKVSAKNMPCVIRDLYAIDAKQAHIYNDLRVAGLDVIDPTGVPFRFSGLWAYGFFNNIKVTHTDSKNLSAYFQFQNAAGLILSRVSINGVSSDQGLINQGNAIDIKNSVAIWISDLQLKNFSGTGISISNSSYLYIKDFTGDAIYSGLSLGQVSYLVSSDVQINNCQSALTSAASQLSRFTNFSSQCKNATQISSDQDVTLLPVGSGNQISLKLDSKVSASLDLYDDFLDDLVAYPFVSVTQTGAVGDGVTDDSLAFSKAIEQSNYVYLPVPAQAYLLKKTITLSKPIHIISGNLSKRGSQGARISFPGDQDVFQISSSGVRISAVNFFPQATSSTHFGIALDLSQNLSGIILSGLSFNRMGGIHDIGSGSLSALKVQDIMSFASFAPTLALSTGNGVFVSGVHISDAAFNPVGKVDYPRVSLKNVTNASFSEFGTEGPAVVESVSASSLSVVNSQNLLIENSMFDTTNGPGLSLENSNNVSLSSFVASLNAYEAIIASNSTINASCTVVVGRQLYLDTNSLPSGLETHPGREGISLKGTGSANFVNTLMLNIGGAATQVDAGVVAQFTGLKVTL